MTQITAKLIKEVRTETGAPMVRVKEVLEEVKGDVRKASAILTKEGFERTAKRAGRATSAGVVAVYRHHTKKVAGVAEVLSETDFVAKNELFLELADNLAMQVASMNPKDEKELLAQDFIKDPKRPVEDLVKEAIAKTGENIQLGNLKRFAIGE